MTHSLRNWYNLVKENSECIACKAVNLPTTPRPEFHHIDPATKLECVGFFVSKKLYIESLAELLKCTPLCTSHHRAFHRNGLDITTPTHKALTFYFWQFAIDNFPHQDIVSTETSNHKTFSIWENQHP